MYITNDPFVAGVAQRCGVDRLWIDLEQRGKEERQRGMNSVKSHHTLDDISRLREVLTTSELYVRVNPLFDGSAAEIDGAIARGAQYVMLPMLRTASDAARFIDLVGGRAKSVLLVETADAADNIEAICACRPDEIHIGLNDMHLSYGLDFMFELLANGTVERLCGVIAAHGIPYGFGGVARLDSGMLPGRHVLGEHYRLGSTRVILSRSFCDAGALPRDEVERTFCEGMKELRDYEAFLSAADAAFFEQNRAAVVREVGAVAELMRARKKEGK